ncbi:MAG TPA: nucleotidyltransferase family protein [Thermoanaerobaculia bacterium]|nr:nucleotidyltransferase family protein [Thermoanaerobaculia bacterium]
MIYFAHRSGTFMPTRVEHHLLRASLSADAVAVRASFDEWKASVDLNDVEYGSLRLLPLLYRNLQKHGIDDAVMPRLKGIYRNAWVRNQLVVQHGLRAMRALREQGIASIVLKGASLVADGSYAELALRPMEDFDLLVAPDEFRRAVDVLRDGGWNFHPASVEAEWYLPYRHAVAFRNGSGELDLHWASIRDRFHGDDAFRRASVDAKLLGEDVRVLAPPDQLLQACGHASARNVDVAPIRWVADVWFLLAKHGDAFDWQRVVSGARDRDLSFAALRCLEYLHVGLGANIPLTVLLELERDSGIASRVSLKLRNSYGPAIYAYVLSVWLRLAFAKPYRGIPRRVALLPKYVRFYFRLPQDASLMRFVARKLRARLAPASSQA